MIHFTQRSPAKRIDDHEVRTRTRLLRAAWIGPLCYVFTAGGVGCSPIDAPRRSPVESRAASVASDVPEPVDPAAAPARPPAVAPHPVTENVSMVVDANNRFALELYRHLRGQSGNLFFSPSSLATALAMTYAGAAGQTEQEMAATLRVRGAPNAFHAAMQELRQSWASPTDDAGIQLRLANRLWGQQGHPFLPAFLELTRDRYGAELARLDFGETETSRVTINDWVEQQTEGEIGDLIPAGQLGSDVRLVLTNAIYFHGSWTDPFDEKQTSEQDFHVSPGVTARARLMHRVGPYRYAAVDDLQLLELPYGDGSLSMVVLLPRRSDGLAELEAQLNVESLQTWTASAALQRVRVHLPSFESTGQFEMSRVLSAMGMPSAFDESRADFSRMTGDQTLFVSAVIHKAFVDVDEQGTTAAAATAVIAPARSMSQPPEPPVFRADHPFAFLIKDYRSGSILFLGRLTSP